MNTSRSARQLHQVRRPSTVLPGRPARPWSPTVAARLLDAGDGRSRSDAALSLQRSVGNASVDRMIRRQPAKTALSAEDAEFYVWELKAVLVHKDKSAIGDVRSPRQAAFAKLFAAVTGRDLQMRKVDAREQ